MKKNEVPQDDIPAFEGRIRKGIYALNNQGDYELQASNGWDAEQVVLDLAVEQYRRQAASAHQQVTAGTASPLAFHMPDKRMDYKQLSQSVGLAVWRVKRHCKAEPFARLKKAMKQRYAEALGLSLGQVECVPEEFDG